MDRTCFKYIFIISHTEKELDQVWKLTWEWI